MPSHHRSRRLLSVLACGALGAAALTAPAVADPPPGATEKQRSVMFVGNNWAGTATVVDARTREVLTRGVDLIPDERAELREIWSDPVRAAMYLAIQQGPGQGHDQYVDDMFTTPDGRYLAVSRPSFADVVWVDLAKAAAGEEGSIVREQSLDGFRADHMGLSPDGSRLLISDSTERQVIEYAMVDQTAEESPTGEAVAMGDRLRTFESGETPHESNYTDDGARIFHASIGKVYTPGDAPALDGLKGDRWFQVVRESDFELLARWDMGRELAEAGYPRMSAAVRPMALSPDGRYVYYQVSFFHGFIEFDTEAADLDGEVSYTAGGVAEPRTGAVKRVVSLPDRVPNLPREFYVNDSAHHGLAMDEDGTTLCVAGTMDDYVALVDRTTLRRTFFDQSTTGHPYGQPYWSTEGPEDTCWVSLAGSDRVAVIDTETAEEIAYLEVGDHPQRIREGTVPESILRHW